MSALGDRFPLSPSQRIGLAFRLHLLLLLVGLCWGAERLVAATYLDSEYLIDSWESDQGLPENSATAMVQTPDGYLWFGTFGGLVRFDGLKFTVFDSGNTPGLANSGIINLFLDASQRIWVSTYRGLAVSEPGQYTKLHPVKEWRGDYVRSFHEDGGVLCATSFDGHVFRAQGEQMGMLPLPLGTNGFGYLGWVDPRGRVWVSQHQSAFFGYWDGQGWQKSDLASVLHPDFVALKGLPDGRLLVVKKQEIVYLSGEQVQRRMPIIWPEKIPEAWSVNQDHLGNVWISSQGLYRVSPTGETRYFSSTNGLTYNSLRFTFQDGEENLWVGTSGGGLLRFKQRTFVSGTEQNGLKNRNVRAVLEESPGSILIGTFGGGLEGGLYRWKEGRITLANPSATGLPRYIQCLLQDRERNIWLGGYASGPEVSGLTILKPTKPQIISNQECGARSVRALFQDSQGRIWIGGGKTVVLCDKGQFTALTPPAENKLDDVRFFAENPQNGEIWAAGREGLFRNSTGQWSEIKGPSGESVLGLACLRFEEDGSLWLGGMEIPFLKRLKNGQWSDLKSRPAAADAHIGCILDDGMGYWWLGSNLGVIRVAHSNLTEVAEGRMNQADCQVFDQSDGLASSECTVGFQNTGAKDSQGRLWFASLKGVSMVDPRTLKLNHHRPPVVPESITYLDRNGNSASLNLGSASATGKANAPWSLPAGFRQMQARFAVLSFSASEKVRLHYELTRNNQLFASKDGNERTVSYPWLPPGSYAMRVTAANNDNVWNHDGCTIAFTVEPFFYQTYWFRVLGALLLVGGGGTSVGLTMKRRMQRMTEALAQRRQQEQLQARLAAILEGTSDLVAFAEPSGKAIYVNDAGRRMLGLELGDSLAGINILEPHNALNEGPIPVRNPAQGQSHEALSFESSWRNHQGNMVPVSQVLIVHRREDGAIDFISTIARDITERKRAENALHEHQQIIKAIVETSQDWIWAVDTSGKHIYSNQAVENILGYTPTEFQEVGLDLLHPDDRLLITACWPQWIEERKGWNDLVLRWRHRDGTYRYLESRAVPNFGPQRELLGFRGVDRDITERKRAEASLRASEARLHDVIEASQDWIWECDPEGVITFSNQSCEAILGYRAAEIYSRQNASILVEEDRREVESRWPKLVGKMQGWRNWIQRWRCKDGSIRWLESNAVPILDPEGHFMGFRGSDRNITERKRIEVEQHSLAERTRRQSTALIELGLSPAISSGNLPRACQEITEYAVRILRVERASIWFIDKAKNALRCEMLWELSTKAGQSGIELPLARLSSFLQLAEGSRTAAIHDVAAEPRLKELTEIYLKAKGTTSLMVATVRLADGLMKVILLENEGSVRNWRADEMAFAGGLADQAAQAWLNAEREQTSAQVRQLALRLLHLQDEERRRIGRELHDSTGQTLAALEIYLGRLRQTAANLSQPQLSLIIESARLASQCADEIRTTSYLMHPPLLDEMGLISALRWFIDGYKKRSKIEVSFEVDDALERLQADQELSLFRMVQEALTNIHRHAGAKNARIRLSAEGDDVVLAIEDDGKGMGGSGQKTPGTQGAPAGVGLTGMRERVSEYQGRLQVESSLAGTKITARMPRHRPA